MPEVQTGRLLNSLEVSELLGMSKRWVEEQSKLGQLPHIRLGNRRKYRAADIEKWLETQAQGN